MPEKMIHCIVCGIEIPKDQRDTGDPRICDSCWRCPNCGVGVEFEDKTGRKMEGLLIEDEYVNCYNCEKGWLVKNFEKVVLRAKKINPVKCPHCKGRGWVFEKCQS